MKLFNFIFITRIINAELIDLNDHAANSLRLALSLENYARFENHGCWCSKFSGALGGGDPKDTLDTDCKTYHSSISCIFLSGGACSNYETFSALRAEGYTFYDSDCESNENECLKAICYIDNLLASQARNYFNDGIYSAPDNSCSVDTESVLRTAAERNTQAKKGGDLEKICVGTAPNVTIETGVVFDYGQDTGFDTEYDTTGGFNFMQRRGEFNGWEYEYDEMEDYEHKSEYLSFDYGYDDYDYENAVPEPAGEPFKTVETLTENVTNQSESISQQISAEKLEFISKINEAKAKHDNLSKKQDSLMNSMSELLTAEHPDFDQLTSLEWQLRMQAHAAEIERVRKECELRDDLIKQQKEQLEYLHGIMETLTKTLCDIK